MIEYIPIEFTEWDLLLGWTIAVAAALLTAWGIYPFIVPPKNGVPNKTELE